MYCPILVDIDWFVLCRAILIPFFSALCAAEQGKTFLFKDLFIGAARADSFVAL